MKTLRWLAATLLLVTLVACGGKEKSEEKSEKSEENGEMVVTPETTKIKGDLGDYYEVVEKEYTLSNDFGTVVSVEVKRTNKDFDFDLTGIEPYGVSGEGVLGNAGFGIEILDEKGNVIDKSSATAGGLSGMYSHTDMEEALKLKPGETGTVRWSFHFDDGKKPAKFRLTSAYERNEVSEERYSSSGSDFEKAYNKAKKEYKDAYDKAQKEYKDAYDKAQKEYKDAYNEAAKEYGL